MLEEIYREQVIQGIDPALRVVKEERLRQLDKWGVQERDPDVWLAILGEEFGEVAKELAEAAIEGRPIDAVKYVKELSHVAAVASAAIQNLNDGVA